MALNETNTYTPDQLITGTIPTDANFVFVTPTGESGVIDKGIQGFSGGPLVVCTYTGAVSGNAYTVTGFYPPAG